MFDALGLRDHVIDDYSSFVRSFLKVREPRLRQFVFDNLDAGILWPEPLVQINPAYESGPNVAQLIAEGLLSVQCAQIFARNGEPLPLYKHQELAIRKAVAQRNFVLTSGTGSGKTLAYFIPIVDHILKHEPSKGGVRAIIIYPMNALINSQLDEFKNKWLANLGPNPPVRVARYTGQEDQKTRERLQQDPPHIVLTNFSMLELMLTRPDERKLVGADGLLRFLVLDEMHTHRGRQGADVALLVRRVRERYGTRDLQCFGTSATMATEGGLASRLGAVAEVATKLFGSPVATDDVIEELLVPRSVRPETWPTAELRNAVEHTAGGSPAQEDLSLLSAWIEHSLGLREEEGRFRRAVPVNLTEAGERLAEASGTSPADSWKALEAAILKPDPNWQVPAIPFKLHQFISQGGTVHATLQPPEDQTQSIVGALSVTPQEDRLFFPVVFCRECGQEYYLCTYDAPEDRFVPRPATGFYEVGEDLEHGYLLLDHEGVWSYEQTEDLPDDWFEDLKSGARRIKKGYERFVPRDHKVRPDGRVGTEGLQAWFVPTPFMACLRCGVVYDRRSKNDYSKLARLSSEGRSSTTTLLGTSSIQGLRALDGLPPTAQKLMSFTDNRQDASLQAGHMNDFISVARLRMALAKALVSLPSGQALTHEDVAQATVAALGLDEADYAKVAEQFGFAALNTKQALQDYVEYRLYEDLRRGWRVNLPNLEQCGLLTVEFALLREVCEDERAWQGNDLLRESTPDERYNAVYAILDYMRRNLAISADALKSERQDALRKRVTQHLVEPWTFGDTEQLRPGPIFVPPDVNRLPGDRAFSELSAVGRFLGAQRRWLNGISPKLDPRARRELIEYLLDILPRAGLLAPAPDNDPRGYQVAAPALRWQPGTGQVPVPDPLRYRRIGGIEPLERQPNSFFQEFYLQNPAILNDINAAEHTGQISKEHRQQREQEFRDGELKCLFCSPTMELGIDIADLNLVHLRNVPPTPANYAQRAGRAGRGGEPALIFTYCSVGSGHDQYYFDRKADIVSGAVAAPALDLLNEELIRAHVHSVWLSYVNHPLGRALNDLLDFDDPSLPVKNDLRIKFELGPQTLTECQDQCQRIIDACGITQEKARWFSSDWLPQTLKLAPQRFDEACSRWREMYRLADEQIDLARGIIDSAHRRRLSREERDNAERLEREAKRMRDLLTNQAGDFESDYYTYRYLASEGFLPGYNFPRLPISAYLSERQQQGEIVQRPRFLALTEFGPRNVIYHEGRKYRVVRTQLPIDGAEKRFMQAKLCNSCGYAHEGALAGIELCENCGSRDFRVETRLFEMAAVTAIATERITSDEEERLRYGYEVTTHFRYPPDPTGSPRVETAQAAYDGKPLMTLAFGQATTLWRVNRGWRRTGEEGFYLDVRSGYWQKRPDDDTDLSPDSGVEQQIVAGVKIMVRDTRNTLMLKPSPDVPVTDAQLVNLQYALRRGIQAEFQLEEDEIAVELIGGDDHRSILMWEASEGGAGVLRRLIEDADAMARVARKALGILHYVVDEQTGEVQFDEETDEPIETPEACGVACYRCLMSYTNQPQHTILDRHTILGILMGLGVSRVEQAHETRSYEEHYQWLLQQVDPDSKLERVFLKAIYDTRRRLPDRAQSRLEDFYSQPDFWYEATHAPVFVDGSVHDSPEQRAKDEEIRDQLRDAGYRVVVIRYDRDMEEQLKENEDVFGSPQA